MEMHAQRANYQTFTWCHAQKQFLYIPSSEVHGWKINDEGSFNFEWTGGNIVPQGLIKILNNDSTGCAEEEEDEDLVAEAETMINVVYEDDSDED